MYLGKKVAEDSYLIPIALLGNATCPVAAWLCGAGGRKLSGERDTRIGLSDHQRRARISDRLLVLVALFVLCTLMIGVAKVEAQKAPYMIRSMEKHCPGCIQLGQALNIPTDNIGIQPGTYYRGGVPIKVVKGGSPTGEYPYIDDAGGKKIASGDFIKLIKAAEKDDKPHGEEMWCCAAQHPGPKDKVCKTCKQENKKNDDKSKENGSDSRENETPKPEQENKHDQKCEDPEPAPPEPNPDPGPGPDPDDGGGGGGGGGGDGGGGGGLEKALQSLAPLLAQGMNRGQQQQEAEQKEQADDGSALIIARAAQTAAAQKTATMVQTPVASGSSGTSQATVEANRQLQIEREMFPPLLTPEPTRMWP